MQYLLMYRIKTQMRSLVTAAKFGSLTVFIVQAMNKPYIPKKKIYLLHMENHYFTDASIEKPGTCGLLSKSALKEHFLFTFPFYFSVWIYEMRSYHYLHSDNFYTSLLLLLWFIIYFRRSVVRPFQVSINSGIF